MSSLQITHAWPLFTWQGQDHVRLLLQLSVHPSCDLVEWCKLRIMRRPNLPLGEWFTSLTRRTGFAVMCLLFVPSAFILFMHMGEAVACTTIFIMLGVKMVDDIIYRGLSPVGNLTNQKPAWGRYHHFYRMINDSTSSMGREPMTYMSHLASYYSWTRTLGNCVASTRWLSNRWRSQLRTRIVV